MVRLLSEFSVNSTCAEDSLSVVASRGFDTSRASSAAARRKPYGLPGQFRASTPAVTRSRGLANPGRADSSQTAPPPHPLASGFSQLTSQTNEPRSEDFLPPAQTRALSLSLACHRVQVSRSRTFAAEAEVSASFEPLATPAVAVSAVRRRRRGFLPLSALRAAV